MNVNVIQDDEGDDFDYGYDDDYEYDHDYYIPIQGRCGGRVGWP